MCIRDRTYHVAATYDGTMIRLYIDGSLVASTAATGGLSPGVTDLTIGRPDYPDARWQGLIDELAIYPTALPPARIVEHHTAGAA